MFTDWVSHRYPRDPTKVHHNNNWPKDLPTIGKAYPQSPNPAYGFTIIKVGDEELIKLPCCYYCVIFIVNIKYSSV